MVDELNLFSVSILDDADFVTILKVGASKEDVEGHIWDEYNNTLDSPYSCLMSVKAHKVKDVDGYKIEIFK